MRVIQGQGAGKGSGIGFLKEVLKVEAGLGAGKSPPPCACTAFWPAALGAVNVAASVSGLTQSEAEVRQAGAGSTSSKHR